MKKMFKIIAMLLVITTVIFAAGCASKTAPTNTTEEAPNGNVVANESITENGTSADVAPEEPTVVKVISDENVADENVTDENVTDENVTDENVTDENVTDENVTDENVTDDNFTDASVANVTDANENVPTEETTA
ncbi:Multimodular transpeptidase-transglycosylase [Methanosarcina lacustris Z-7289]|uniref:Multimodular transpeptidase-transglycosylase n=1 Tax=Methanosarcina lacustris Z-7289 TaxID=1434111 RepID=A0A0E3S0T9_9EURY|nr:hypothetical protein [Methanosarcina lacustris]AKB73626.1 Multimodular transpeptidase-transglycosylase [Methanosarcina lacustris Z-7289]